MSGKWFYTACGVVSGGLGRAVPALAADATAPPDLTAASVKMLAVLCGIIGLLLAASYLMKKTNLFGKSLMGKNRDLEVLETLYLGPKKSLALVRAGRERIVIGVTPTTISAIAMLNADADGTKGRGSGSPDTFESRLENAQANLMNEESCRAAMKSPQRFCSKMNIDGLQRVLSLSRFSATSRRGTS